MQPIQQGLTNSETEELAYFALDNMPDEIDLMNPNWLADALDIHSSAFIR